jgi:hypothetical protein
MWKSGFPTRHCHAVTRTIFDRLRASFARRAAMSLRDVGHVIPVDRGDKPDPGIQRQPTNSR